VEAVGLHPAFKSFKPFNRLLTASVQGVSEVFGHFSCALHLTLDLLRRTRGRIEVGV
jgi:hypothetical protein